MADRTAGKSPQSRASAAIAALYRRAEQTQDDMDALWEHAVQLSELEEKIGTRAARLQDKGISVSELSQATGMHPNRIHRLISRHENSDGE